MRIQSLLALLFLAQPSIAQEGKPKKLDTGEAWVQFADYPTDARWERRQGRTRVTLTVDKNGRVTSCKVRKSSLHKDLDRAACSALELRARFTPATDDNGHAVRGEYKTSVTWKLEPLKPGELYPASDPSRWFKVIDWPDHAWIVDLKKQVSTQLRVSDNGEVTECKIRKTSGYKFVDEAVCDALLRNARFHPLVVESGTDPDTWVNWTMIIGDG